MESNSVSGSSSLDGVSDNKHRRIKKLLRKRLLKEQGPPLYVNDDSKSARDSKDGIEEEKSEHITPKGHNRIRSSFVVASDSNNGYFSGEESSHHSPRRKPKKAVMKEINDEELSHSSQKTKRKHIKLKVKKIDEEGVSSDHIQAGLLFLLGSQGIDLYPKHRMS